MITGVRPKERPMEYARNVHVTLKAGKEKEFRGLMEREVLPMLKQQGGFREELAMVTGTRAVGISIWDSKEDAQRYEHSAFPKVLEHLRPIIEGQPKIELFEVATLARTR
jgi:heme-degrading monooxygenase HmoA